MFANLVGSLIQAGVVQGMQGQENKAFADLVGALGQEANRQPLPEPVFSGGGAQGVQEDFMAPMTAAMGRVMGLPGGEGWKENVWDRTAGRPAPTDALALFNTAAAHGKVRPEEQANLLRFVGEQLAARNEASARAGMDAARNAWADAAGGLDLNDPNAAFGHLARSLPLFGAEGAAQARQMLEHVRPHQGFSQVDLGDRVDVVAQDPWSGTARRAYGGEKGVPAETRFREGAANYRAGLGGDIYQDLQGNMFRLSPSGRAVPVQGAPQGMKPVGGGGGEYSTVELDDGTIATLNKKTGEIVPTDRKGPQKGTPLVKLSEAARLLKVLEDKRLLTPGGVLPQEDQAVYELTRAAVARYLGEVMGDEDGPNRYFDEKTWKFQPAGKDGTR
jgi:hypothetical protein